MTRSVSTRGVDKPLDNAEAAALINIILDNTTTSAPTRAKVQNTSRSLADIFPVSVLAAA